MESWSCATDGKGLLFPDEIDLPIDVFARDRRLLMGWDNRPPSNFENDSVISGREAVQRMELMDLGLSEMIKRPFSSNSSVEMVSSDVAAGSCKKVASPSRIITSNLCFGEEESVSKASSSIVEPTGHDSSLIALKLGRLADSRDAQNRKVSEERPVFSAPNLQPMAKRTRTRGPYSQTPFCQVLGCNMDLSSSKDYHKRHKVCDVHSKTAKVIVNGIEQRFCQQCSRFHLLAEFDDGKRSCRRRLAGHNERRRKPQLDSLSYRQHRLLPAFLGSRFTRASLTKGIPFAFPDVLPGGGKYDPANPCRPVTFKEEPDYCSRVTIPILNGQLLPKSFLNLYGSGKPLAIGSPASGIEDQSIYNSMSTLQKLSGASGSGSALSLLSSQSEDFSGLLAGIPTASIQILQSSCAGSIPDRRKISTEKCGEDQFSSPVMKSSEVGLMSPVVGIDATHSMEFEGQAEGIVLQTEYVNAKSYASLEHSPTVDLLQLSSHLQRVEKQRNSLQMKQANDEPFCLPNV